MFNQKRDILVFFLCILFFWQCGKAPSDETEVAAIHSDAWERSCGIGFDFDTTHKICVTNYEILGPFTPYLIETCKSLANGTSNAQERATRQKICQNIAVWEKKWGLQVLKFAANKQASDPYCLPGTQRDKKTRLCMNGDDVYGPFASWMIKKCEKYYRDMVCEYNRWSRKMAEDILDAGPTGVPKSAKGTAARPASNGTTVGNGVVRLKSAPYLCQRDNEISPAGSCQATSAMMAANALGKTGGFRNPDDMMRRFGREWLKETGTVASALREMGLKGTQFFAKGSESQIKAAIRSGFPVILQLCSTNSGHFINIIGYDSKGWIVNDPYGRWNGGVYACYSGFPDDGLSIGASFPFDTRCEGQTGGKGIHYSYGNIRRAAAEYNTDGKYWITIVKP
jgi:hypothetical protein